MAPSATTPEQQAENENSGYLGRLGWWTSRSANARPATPIAASRVQNAAVATSLATTPAPNPTPAATTANGSNGSNGVNGARNVAGRLPNNANGSNGPASGRPSAGVGNGAGPVPANRRAALNPPPRKVKPSAVAIVGMACRFPGDASNPSEFWELLSRCRSGFTEIPKERFNASAFYHPNPVKGGTLNPVGGNFLNVDLSNFDAPFFGMTEKEAISLDPQQRLLLECTFEALENAGVPKQNIVGKDVGVFIGGSFPEYESHLFRDTDTIPMHQATGTRKVPDCHPTWPVANTCQVVPMQCNQTESRTSSTCAAQVLLQIRRVPRAWSPSTRRSRVFVQESQVLL